MFIRIQINWIDHLEILKIQVYEAQVEVRPYDLSALNFTCTIEVHLCLVCCSGTIVQ